jgi:glycosyltransferase involved in cell wall biosynthesis
MHILISALHRPTNPTGVCRHAVNLAQCPIDIDKVTKVTLVMGLWQQQYFETTFDLRSEKIDLVYIDIKNSSLARNIWFWRGLPKLADRLRPDLVHLSFPLPFDRSQFSCPVVSTIHDLYAYECPENFGRIQAFFNRLFLRQCVKQSDGIICVSQTTFDRFNFFFSNRPNLQELTVIYNIIDFNNVEPKIPAFSTEIESTPFLLTVGQHRKNKNLGLLINSYAFLLKTKQIEAETNLIIVGSNGPETENLIRQIQELNLELKVYLLGSIDDRELCWLYQHCQVFVAPSAIEGFCLPLAEAIHLFCRVVCADIPIFREIGSSDCIYFDLQTDPIEHLSTAIIKAIQQPLSCDDRQPSQFSKAIIGDRHFQFYLDILNKHQ